MAADPELAVVLREVVAAVAVAARAYAGGRGQVQASPHVLAAWDRQDGG
jgi:hypothetical protein